MVAKAAVNPTARIPLQSSSSSSSIPAGLLTGLPQESQNLA